MSAGKTWRPLPLSGADGLPPLLVAFEAKASEYSIQITDMANIWTESLERRAICIRAWGEGTSIDPSDTPENMGRFLQTLRCALDETVSGHDDTAVILSPGSASDSGEDGLKLVATCDLPGFEPLKWPFHLKKSSSGAVAAEFAIPLVGALYSQSRQIEMLVQALRSKDSVIAKLSDKLEATGTGLEHVFTALSGRKKVTRESANDKIRGLAPFDDQKMKAELQDQATQLTNATDLVQKVFGGANGLSDSTITIEPGNMDGWWKDFSSTSSLPHRSVEKLPDNAMDSEAAALSSPPEAVDVTMEDDDDDEFQVQSTPPRFKSKHEDNPPGEAHKASKPIKEEPAPSQEQKKPLGRLGAIGGKKKALSPPPPAPKSATPSPPKNKAAVADDDETASETASDVDETASLPDEAASSPAPATPPPSAKPAAKKGGLGRIGGGKPKPPPAQEDEVEGAPATSAPPVAKAEANATAQKRLGVIGKRIGGGATASGDATKDGVQRGRGTSRNASEGAAEGKRETSQERADRKREELKKDLEKKAAAGPAKKKRRF